MGIGEMGKGFDPFFDGGESGEIGRDNADIFCGGHGEGGAVLFARARSRVDKDPRCCLRKFFFDGCREIVRVFDAAVELKNEAEDMGGDIFAPVNIKIAVLFVEGEGAEIGGYPRIRVILERRSTLTVRIGELIDAPEAGAIHRTMIIMVVYANANRLLAETRTQHSKYVLLPTVVP